MGGPQLDWESHTTSHEPATRNVALTQCCAFKEEPETEIYNESQDHMIDAAPQDSPVPKQRGRGRPWKLAQLQGNGSIVWKCHAVVLHLPTQVTRVKSPNSHVVTINVYCYYDTDAQREKIQDTKGQECTTPVHKMTRHKRANQNRVKDAQRERIQDIKGQERTTPVRKNTRHKRASKNRGKRTAEPSTGNTKAVLKDGFWIILK